MSEFFPGQRWISDTEAELGLGVILAIEHRSVTVLFAASGDTRVYAKDDAPLTRVHFSTHDVIQSHEGWSLTVSRVEEQDHLLIYHGHKENNGEDNSEASIPEGELNNFIQLNKPQERLFSAQLDKNSQFELRYKTLQKLHELTPSPVRGLAGVRVSLVPHQIYIAHEVASRSAPRVLLADEVGLGKTIEAGLIIHQQLLTERAQRVLIIVPEPLLHQWLVEMLRRFNLRFSIFDESRCESLQEEGNPFLSEQLILCSLPFLTNNPAYHEQAMQGEWDLLVVDEAHHLQWSPQKASAEYTLVEQLTLNTKGVLLLTATPEQLGAASHFARLRLLDADRFFSLDEFLEEEELYQPVARAVDDLLGLKDLSDETLATLEFALGKQQDFHPLLATVNNPTIDDTAKQAARDQLIHLLVDRHGTGRILFRNTRSAIKGFPQRQVHPSPLDAPAEYHDVINPSLENEEARNQFAEQFGVSYAKLALAPEQIYQSLKALGITTTGRNWTQFDPRVNWLTNTLQELKKNKVLVICANAESALELEQALRTQQGIRAAVFHEGLSIIERDRAAAYFAVSDGGAQVLICSEIGSEGRNFQFSHHLILFDLPLNPDLLEQRIGRLDRIGQQHTIEIHVPYMRGTAQEIMYRWYQEGIDAFSRTCPAGQGVFAEVGQDLQEMLARPSVTQDELDALLAKTQPVFAQINSRLQSGRDRLLELNSYRKQESDMLLSHIRQLDQSQQLADYMQQVFDAYGVEHEDHRIEHCFVAHPGDHMLVHNFPELGNEGVTATYQRDTALAHEDMVYLSWEHPMVTGAMEMVLSHEHGNACLAVFKHPGIKTGEILLEAIFTIECSAARDLQLERFLPPTVIRKLISKNMHDLSEKLPFEKLTAIPVELDKHTQKQILTSQQKRLRAMLLHAEEQAGKNVAPLLSHYRSQMDGSLGKEYQRLKALQQVNPNVRDEELDYLQQQQRQLHDAMQQAQLRLDSLRVLIAG